MEEVESVALLQMLMSAIGDWRALGWQAGLSGIITMLIASVKNSALRTLIWDRLKWGKVFVAPVLSLILIGLGASYSGQSFDIGVLLLALVTGAGALAIHEILDGIKYIPGIGSKWVALIDLVGKLLKKPEKKS